jgi:hypothetical protein
MTLAMSTSWIQKVAENPGETMLMALKISKRVQPQGLSAFPISMPIELFAQGMEKRKDRCPRWLLSRQFASALSHPSRRDARAASRWRLYCSGFRVWRSGRSLYENLGFGNQGGGVVGL